MALLKPSFGGDGGY